MGSISVPTALLGSSLIGGASSLIGGSQVSGAAGDATQWLKNVYGSENSQLQPYMNTGQNALYSLASLLGVNSGAPGGAGGSASPNGPSQAFQSFTNTPYYQFPLQQAMLQLQRSQASKGLLSSGATAKDILSQATGYASSGLGSYLSQLSGLAGSGQAASESLGSTGAGVGSNVLNGALTGAGASAAGLAGAGSNISSALQTAAVSPYFNSGFNATSYGSGTPAGAFLPYGSSGASALAPAYQFGAP